MLGSHMEGFMVPGGQRISLPLLVTTLSPIPTPSSKLALPGNSFPRELSTAVLLAGAEITWLD